MATMTAQEFDDLLRSLLHQDPFRPFVVEYTHGERFGPLGDEARERLKKWDQDQLDTASRRLPDVRSLAELGLED